MVRLFLTISPSTAESISASENCFMREGQGWRLERYEFSQPAPVISHERHAGPSTEFRSLRRHLDVCRKPTGGSNETLTSSRSCHPPDKSWPVAPTNQHIPIQIRQRNTACRESYERHPHSTSRAMRSPRRSKLPRRSSTKRLRVSVPHRWNGKAEGGGRLPAAGGMGWQERNGRDAQPS